jgi:hypothetical protein
MTDLATEADARVPLMIGAIGHRDLLGSELDLLRTRVREFFESLQRRYPDLRVTLLTSLADGADRLVGDVAQSLGMPIVYVLPMASELYERDFGAESRAEYREILGSSDVLTLPLVGDATADDVTHPGPARDLQYAWLGAFIAAHCHILLALWDGRENGGSGGTAQIIRFHQEDYMPGLDGSEPRPRIDDADDESDLVYHVVCSRDRPDGAPIGPLRAGEAWWFSRDDREPRTREMPHRYEIVLERMIEFSRDVVLFREPIAQCDNALLPSGSGLEVAEGDRAIAALFGIADWLAKHYQRRMLTALRLLYSFAALAGVCLVAYGDLPQQEMMIYPYLAFMAAAIVTALLTRQGAWQRKSQDYRVLAEALRVQFYWAIAAVERPAPSRFGHDAFLKRQDLELGWIRNLLRVAGRRDDAGGHVVRDEGIEIAVRDWVGDDAFGQMSYYRRRASALLRLHRITAAIDRTSLLVGLVIAAWLAAAHYWSSSEPTDIWIALMGIFPIAATVRQAYANRIAEHELINQYQYMDRIMSNARRQLQRTSQPSERRKILRELGDAALRENSQWILRLRERPITTPS